MIAIRLKADVMSRQLMQTRCKSKRARLGMAGGAVVGCALLIGLSGCLSGDGVPPALKSGVRKLHKVWVNAGEGELDPGRRVLLDKAVRLLEKARTRRPDSASVHLNLGLAYWMQGKTDNAIVSLGRAGELSPSDPRPMEFLAMLYQDLDLWDDARGALDLANQRLSYSPRILTAMGVVDYHSGQFERAESLFGQAVELAPDYVPALYNLGVFHRDHEHNPHAAREVWLRFLEGAEAALRGMDSPRQRRALSRRVSRVRDVLGLEPQPEPKPEPAPEPAREPEPRIETRVSGSPDAGGAARSTAPAGRSTMEAALREARSNVSRARQAMAREEFDAALVLLKQAVKGAPYLADAWWELAVLYDRHLGLPDEAQRVYRIFAGQFPDDPRIEDIPRNGSTGDREDRPGAADGARPRAMSSWGRGLEAQRAGRMEDAAALYEQAVELDPRFAAAWYNLGLAYEELGRHADAVGSFRRTLEIEPDMTEARYMLAVAYRALGQYAEAEAVLREVLRRDASFVRAQFVLGLVLEKLGRPQAALDAYERFLQAAPDDAYAAAARRRVMTLR